jgi:hypothetical protein
LIARMARKTPNALEPASPIRILLGLTLNNKYASRTEIKKRVYPK